MNVIVMKKKRQLETTLVCSLPPSVGTPRGWNLNLSEKKDKTLVAGWRPRPHGSTRKFSLNRPLWWGSPALYRVGLPNRDTVPPAGGPVERRFGRSHLGLLQRSSDRLSGDDRREDPVSSYDGHLTDSAIPCARLLHL